jgi:hypothetical protein
MLIKSVAVRSFRTIQNAKVDLTPGLNVIHGDNDVGKSTLMEALRAGLVRRGRLTGKRFEEMRSHDGGQPEVEVVFEHGGAEYRVHKKFGSNGSTRLHRRAPGGVLREVTGDPDEALFNVLCFGERITPGRSADLGILPLIWVRQGTSGTPMSEIMSGDPRAALSARLAEIGGSALDGAGADHLFARACAEYGCHFTERNGDVKKGSPLFVAGEELSRASAAADALRAQRAELEGVFEERQRCERDRHATIARLPALTQEAERAHAQCEEIRTLVGQRATAEAEAKTKRLEAKAARERLAARHALTGEMADLHERLATHASAVEDAAERLLTHDTGREESAGRAAAAAAQELAVSQQHRLARGLLTMLLESAALETLESRRAEADGKHRSILALQANLGGMRLRAADVDAMGKLERDAETAAAVLEAAAASVEIVALKDGSLAVDAEDFQVRAGERLTRQVAARTTLRIGKVAEVIVHPGGKDLTAAREAASAKQAAFRRALAEASVASLTEARAAVEARRTVEGELAVARAQLAAIAPSGLVGLEEQCAAQRAKVLAARAVLNGADVTAADADDARARAADAERREGEARDASEAARAALAAHDAQRAQLFADHRVAEAEAGGYRRRLAELEADHAASVTRYGLDDALAEMVRAAEALASEATHGVAALDAQLAGRSPDTAQRRADATARARDAALTERTRLDQEIHGLDARLDQADVLDLDERIEAVEAHVENATKEHERCREDADGVRLLHEMMRACRAEAESRFLAPLQGEVQRLARLLDPTSKIDLDADYGVTLERAAFGSHAFDSLGGGCKEQVATVIRLATASVLAGGDVLPVVFDDAMVNTSDARFNRMADVLLDMASRLQLIVLTCHWERYAALGAHNVVDLGRVRGQLEARLAAAG